MPCADCKRSVATTAFPFVCTVESSRSTHQSTAEYVGGREIRTRTKSAYDIVPAEAEICSTCCAAHLRGYRRARVRLHLLTWIGFTVMVLLIIWGIRTERPVLAIISAAIVMIAAIMSGVILLTEYPARSDQEILELFAISLRQTELRAQHGRLIDTTLKVSGESRAFQNVESADVSFYPASTYRGGRERRNWDEL